jgi:membrane protein DedA with SNARE-associated domain
LLNWVADQLFLLMNGLYGRFGVPIVFVAALTEATFGLGVVFPGVVLMFLAGAYTRSDPAQLAAVFVVAVVGTMIGDTLSYGLGRWGSRFVESSRFAPSLRLGRALVTGRTRWVIPFYHLHSVTRAVGPFGAGAVRMPLRIWVPLDYLGAMIANAVWVGSGAVFGTAVLTDRGTLNPHPALRVGLALAAVVWFLVMQHLVTKRLDELNRGTEGVTATPPDPSVEVLSSR